MNEQKEREDFEEMVGLGTWGDDAYTDFKDGWLARAEIAERDRVDADLALDLLELEEAAETFIKQKKLKWADSNDAVHQYLKMLGATEI